jgi:hypothetical protein
LRIASAPSRLCRVEILEVLSDDLTNAFSKKFENHCHMVALYAVWYNFVRIHKALRCSPAMEAEITERLLSVEDIVQIVDEWEASPTVR